MVFFGTNYEAHINDEYGVTSYFNYEILKILTHNQEEDESTPYSEHKKAFAELFEKELSRVDDEFADYLNKNDYLMVDCRHLANGLKVYKGNKAGRKAQEASLKRNLTVLYRKLSDLETYRLLNRTLIIKILKKYDKVHKKHGDPVFESLMSTLEFYRLGNGRKLEDFHVDVEMLYAEFFCDGLREEAQGKLTLSKGEHRPKKMFFLAGKIGIFLTLVAWFFFDMSVSPSLTTTYFLAKDPAVYVYAFVAALIVYRWIWGFNVYMWESAGIDYILLLDLDAKKSNIKPSYDQIFSEASNYSILFFVNIIVFHAIKLSNEHLDESEYTFAARNAYVLPTMLLMGVVGTALNNCRHISYGVFSLNVFLHCFTAPFTAVTFRHTYAADILTSFTKVIGFAALSGCYYTSGTYLYSANKERDYGSETFETCDNWGMHLLKTLIYVAPLYMRFMQNMRQQYDSIQRRKEVAAQALTVVPVEHDSEDDMDMEKAESGEDEVKDDEVQEFESSSSKALTHDTCSPRAGKGGEVHISASGRRIMSHSESSLTESDVPTPRSQDDVKGLYTTHFLKVKKFVFSYLLIWPYSYNALKYFLSIMVVVFGAYPPQDPDTVSYKVCYLSLACISTMYSTYWDFRNDW
eukprot:CAMPEP_0114424970 /NCGR_PEP_ID=MMETSP0103-20121206/6980_1 /TAXON_ID=37642 ORGANISM="Paraphysomonas imperforata, Strain PA2" /NCGR_SAMPLE_ID=MMETSP0103 /ASSEMBLY_ACC=CAM_ASM_000201 /LENGTH=633 /DNA_ID=CAMNT_0001593763 /DNA_START=63 /DNA_END=1961 /DNA_ORIENTATION=+